MTRRRYLRRFTLNSEEVRDIYRDEVDDAAIEALRPSIDYAVSGETVTLPIGEYRCPITARSGRGRALIVKVSAPVIMGRWGAETFKMLRIAVAPTSVSGAFLRREWVSDVFSLRDIKCPTPWCAVELFEGMLAYPFIINSLGEFVARLAWAWIDRAPIASA